MGVIRWWWIRHGPTRPGYLTGWSDVDVDLSDVTALAVLADHLPQDAVIVASDLRRASLTADAIAGRRRRLPDTACLREFNFGDWDGQRIDAVSEDARAFWTDPEANRPPNGETWTDVRRRVDRFVDHVTLEAPARDIIAVAHMGVILGQVQRATHTTVHDAMARKIHHLSMTRIHHDQGQWSMHSANQSAG